MERIKSNTGEIHQEMEQVDLYFGEIYVELGANRLDIGQNNFDVG